MIKQYRKKKKKKIMISLATENMSNKEIFAKRDAVKNKLKKDNWLVIDTFFSDMHIKDKEINMPLRYLAESLKIMSNCDAVYFCKGYADSHNCYIEHSIAKSYGLKIIYE